MPAAVTHLTEDVFARLPFEALAPAKGLLKVYFSDQPWTDEQAGELADLLAAADPPEGWWEHPLPDGFVLRHGYRQGRYRLEVSGGEDSPRPSLFDRVFSGPVLPEATPNPRHVKFNVGGRRRPARWYGPGDAVDDPRVAALLEDEDVADVLTAGDFVTVGLRRAALWEVKLDVILDRVAGLFSPDDDSDEPGPAGVPTREALVEEGRRTAVSVEALHLLNPDDPAHRARLAAALDDPDPRVRRVAVAVLAQTDEAALAGKTLSRMAGDPSRIVRRTTVDAAVDRGDESLRPLLHRFLDDADPWVRWKAVRGIAELGVGGSRAALEELTDDADFQVRFEVAAVLRKE